MGGFPQTPLVSLPPSLIYFRAIAAVEIKAAALCHCLRGQGRRHDKGAFTMLSPCPAVPLGGCGWTQPRRTQTSREDSLLSGQVTICEHGCPGDHT